MPGLFPVASGGIHVWHMPALVTYFRRRRLSCSSAAARWAIPGVTQPVQQPTVLRWEACVEDAQP